MKSSISIATLVAITLTPALVLCAQNSNKLKLKVAGNRKVTYLVNPESANDWSEVFSNGVFYGRFRQNAFLYEWQDELEGKRKNNYAQGIGGSLLFRSAPLKGFSFTTGVYTSHSPFVTMDQEDIGRLKAGKDVLARRNVRDDNDYNLTVLGQAFVEYKQDLVEIRIGRQLYESLYTASNDTKMIPNTFDGATLSLKTSEKSELRVAWLAEQKLRDHTTSHDVITFKDASGDSWANQDDSAIHKGLSYAAFKHAGASVNHDLWLMDYQNDHLKNLSIKVSAYTIPTVLKATAIEFNTKYKSSDWVVAPGLRLMKQIDDGAGAIGGAAINGLVNAANPAGYTDPQNLDSTLWAGRIIVSPPIEGIEAMLGYSKVENAADFVAPWRAFPTGGYTRAMGQYNWRANNQTTMLQLKFDFQKLAGWKGMNATLRYAIQDEDEAKGYYDRNVIHFDLTKKLQGNWNNTELKFRYAHVNDNGADSYAEYRFETNILF